MMLNESKKWNILLKEHLLKRDLWLDTDYQILASQYIRFFATLFVYGAMEKITFWFKLCLFSINVVNFFIAFLYFYDTNYDDIKSLIIKMGLDKLFIYP